MKPFKTIAASLVLTLVAIGASGASDGQDIVFDIVDSVSQDGKAAIMPAGGGGGQDIIVFDIVDS